MTNEIPEVITPANDRAKILSYLREVARREGIAKLARDIGATREHLSKVLNGSGNPTLESLIKICKALKVKISIGREQ